MILIAAALALVSWIVLSASPWHRWPSELELPSPPDAESDGDGLAVIVPARNEAATLPSSLPSLVDQVPGRVWVADDGSSDGTADLAAAVVGEERVLRCPPRPSGWSGKVHALGHAVERICELDPEVEWFLFTDADIRHRPGSIAALRLTADGGEGFQLVSIMARLNATTFWEKVLVPPFVYFFHLLYPFRAVVSTSTRVAAAAGGCVLVERRALESAGGLAAISGALIDDVSLAKIVKRSGGRVWLGFDDGIVSIREYTFAGLWQMVARNAFVQLRFSWLLLLFVVLTMGAVFVAPPGLAAMGVVAAVSTDDQFLQGLRWPVEEPFGGSVAAWLLGCGLGAWLLQALSLSPFVRHHKVGALFGWTLPLASLLYLAMTVSSAVNHLRGRTSSWRGRTYDK